MQKNRAENAGKNRKANKKKTESSRKLYEYLCTRHDQYFYVQLLNSRISLKTRFLCFWRASLLPFWTPQVDRLLKKYEGRYKEMFQRLDDKYTKTDSRRKVGEGAGRGVLMSCMAVVL